MAVTSVASHSGLGDSKQLLIWDNLVEPAWGTPYKSESTMSKKSTS